MSSCKNIFITILMKYVVVSAVGNWCLRRIRRLRRV